MTLNSPGGSTLQCGGGSGITCHWIRPNVSHIGILLHLVLISTTSLQSTCHSAPVSEILSKTDHPRQKKHDAMSIFKMVYLGHLAFVGSNNGFFEKPNYINSYRSSIDTIAVNCLVFQKIAFLHFGVKIQDGNISAILDFRGPVMGSLKSPCTTSCRSSIDTIAPNCLLFEKIAFFCISATDRWTASMH